MTAVNGVKTSTITRIAGDRSRTGSLHIAAVAFNDDSASLTVQLFCTQKASFIRRPFDGAQKHESSSGKHMELLMVSFRQLSWKLEKKFKSVIHQFMKHEEKDNALRMLKGRLLDLRQPVRCQVPPTPPERSRERGVMPSSMTLGSVAFDRIEEFRQNYGPADKML